MAGMGGGVGDALESMRDLTKNLQELRQDMVTGDDLQGLLRRIQVLEEGGVPESDGDESYEEHTGYTDYGTDDNGDAEQQLFYQSECED